MRKFIITEEERKHIKGLYEQQNTQIGMKNPENVTFTPDVFNAAIGFLNSDSNPEIYDNKLKLMATGYLVDMRDDKKQNIPSNVFTPDAINLAKEFLFHSANSKKTNPKFNEQNSQFIKYGEKIKSVEIIKNSNPFGSTENIQLKY